MRKKQLPSRTVLLLNGAAILIVGASLAAVARSTFFGDDVPPCKERFTTAMRLSLERDGVPATVAGLQGQLANSDWNLVDAARVVSLSSGPAKQAFELDLAKVPSVARTSGETRAGIGFSWMPQPFKRREAACLTYSVRPGENFSFGRGGRLPGLQGSSTAEGDGPQATVSVRFAWNASGELDTYSQLSGWPEGRSLGGKRGKLALEPGRWSELEQEIVLNTPGKPDGVLRVWQDGRLIVQRTDILYRTSPSLTLSGVLAETVGGAPADEAKRGPQTLWLTPFELRWP
jgi:hypothetical protein